MFINIINNPIILIRPFGFILNIHENFITCCIHSKTSFYFKYLYINLLVYNYRGNLVGRVIDFNTLGVFHVRVENSSALKELDGLIFVNYKKIKL